MKVIVETLGFQHLDLEVTGPRTIIFRDAIVDLLQVDMGSRFSRKAKEGWKTVLNYVGGSYIYVRTKFAVRLKILLSSWATANCKAAEIGAEEDESEKDEQAAEGGESGGKSEEKKER